MAEKGDLQGDLEGAIKQLTVDVQNLIKSQANLGAIARHIEPIVNGEGYPPDSPIVFALLGIDPIEPVDVSEATQRKAEFINIKEGLKKKLLEHQTISDNLKKDLEKKQELIKQSEVFIGFHPHGSTLHTMTIATIDKAKDEMAKIQEKLAEHESCCPEKKEKLEEVSNQIHFLIMRSLYSLITGDVKCF